MSQRGCSSGLQGLNITEPSQATCNSEEGATFPQGLFLLRLAISKPSTHHKPSNITTGCESKKPFLSLPVPFPRSLRWPPATKTRAFAGDVMLGIVNRPSCSPHLARCRQMVDGQKGSTPRGRARTQPSWRGRTCTCRGLVHRYKLSRCIRPKHRRGGVGR